MTASLLVVGLVIASAVLIIGGEVWSWWHDRRYKQTTTKSQISITMSQEPAMHVCGQLTIPDPNEAEATEAEALALPWADPETGEIHEGASA